MTEAQMEKIAERAAEIAVAKFREQLRGELDAVLQGVASLDPTLIDGAAWQWMQKEISHHTSGMWIPQDYTIIERLTMAIGCTREFKTQLHNAFRNIHF